MRVDKDLLEVKNQCNQRPISRLLGINKDQYSSYIRCYYTTNKNKVKKIYIHTACIASSIPDVLEQDYIDNNSAIFCVGKSNNNQNPSTNKQKTGNENETQQVIVSELNKYLDDQQQITTNNLCTIDFTSNQPISALITPDPSAKCTKLEVAKAFNKEQIIIVLNDDNDDKSDTPSFIVDLDLFPKKNKIVPNLKIFGTNSNNNNNKTIFYSPKNLMKIWLKYPDPPLNLSTSTNFSYEYQYLFPTCKRMLRNNIRNEINVLINTIAISFTLALTLKK